MGSVSTKEGSDSTCASREVAAEAGGLPMRRDRDDVRLERSSTSCSAEVKAPDACRTRKSAPESSSMKKMALSAESTSTLSALSLGETRSVTSSDESPCSRIGVSGLGPDLGDGEWV